MKTAANNYIDNHPDLVDFFTFNEKLEANNYRKVSHARICKELAQKILRENKTIICNGRVYHFVLTNMGLGVYNVRLANLPEDRKETVLEK